MPPPVDRATTADGDDIFYVAPGQDPLIAGAYWAADFLLGLIYPVLIEPGDLGGPAAPLPPD